MKTHCSFVYRSMFTNPKLSGDYDKYYDYDVKLLLFFVIGNTNCANSNHA